MADTNRYPADNRKRKDLQKGEITFLTDPKVDAELYAYYQSLSISGEKIGELADGKPLYETIVYKKDIPTQTNIVKAVNGLNNVRTFARHRQYLLDKGYLIEKEDRYIIPPKEKGFFVVPKEISRWFSNTVKKPVVKTYILLGSMWQWKSKIKEQYVFTLKDLAEHLGLNTSYQTNIDAVHDYIILLRKVGLIDYVVFTKPNAAHVPVQYMRLTKISLKCPTDGDATE